MFLKQVSARADAAPPAREQSAGDASPPLNFHTLTFRRETEPRARAHFPAPSRKRTTTRAPRRVGAATPPSYEIDESSARTTKPNRGAVTLRRRIVTPSHTTSHRSLPAPPLNLANPLDTPVKDVMSTALHPGSPEMTRDEAADLLQRHRIHHAVVNTVEGKFAGLFSSWDIARECALDAKVIRVLDVRWLGHR